MSLFDFRAVENTTFDNILGAREFREAEEITAGDEDAKFAGQEPGDLTFLNILRLRPRSGEVDHEGRGIPKGPEEKSRSPRSRPGDFASCWRASASIGIDGAPAAFCWQMGWSAGGELYTGCQQGLGNLRNLWVSFRNLVLRNPGF